VQFRQIKSWDCYWGMGIHSVGGPMLPWLSAGCTLCFPCPHEVLLGSAKFLCTLHVLSIVDLGFVLYVLRFVQPMTSVSSSFLYARLVEMRSQQVSCSLLPYFITAPYMSQQQWLFANSFEWPMVSYFPNLLSILKSFFLFLANSKPSRPQRHVTHCRL
jgi:hypothetical protein